MHQPRVYHELAGQDAAADGAQGLAQGSSPRLRRQAPHIQGRIRRFTQLGLQDPRESWHPVGKRALPHPTRVHRGLPVQAPEGRLPHRVLPPERVPQRQGVPQHPQRGQRVETVHHGQADLGRRPRTPRQSQQRRRGAGGGVQAVQEERRRVLQAGEDRGGQVHGGAGGFRGYRGRRDGRGRRRDRPVTY